METLNNRIIYENAEKTLYVYEQELFKGSKRNIKKLSFEEFIREIDICPDKNPEWKQETIMQLAREVGFIRDVA